MLVSDLTLYLNKDLRILSICGKAKEVRMATWAERVGQTAQTPSRAASHISLMEPIRSLKTNNIDIRTEAGGEAGSTSSRPHETTPGACQVHVGWRQAWLLDPSLSFPSLLVSLVMGTTVV